MGKRSATAKRGRGSPNAGSGAAAGAGTGIKVLPTKGDDILAGVRYHTEPDAGEAQSWPASILACTTLALFVGWIHILTGLILYALYFRSAAAFTTWAVLVSTIWWPCQTHWQGFLDWHVWATWRAYFSFSLVFDAKLDGSRKYIFAQVPHVFPFGPILAGTIVNRIFTSIKCYAVSASNVFWVPGIRHMFAWMGAMPATRRNFQRLLSEDGAACAVVVDGLAGMYMQDPNVEKIVLANRRGFIKVALAAGADLVPTYHFGNTSLLSILGKSLQGLSRALRFSFLIQYGRFWLPVPRRIPIMMAVGKPVPVKKMTLVKGDEKSEAAFNAEVERLHKLFVAGMVATYEKYRAVYNPGWADKPIAIVK